MPILIFSVFILMWLFITLTAYAVVEDFQKHIDQKFLNLLKIIASKRLSIKFTKFSNELYVLSVNLFAGGTLIGLQNIDLSPIFANAIFFISFLIYLFGLSIKIDQNFESFEKDYLSDFLLAVVAGYVLAFLFNLHSYLQGKSEFNEFNLIFLILFLWTMFIKLKNDTQNKASETI